MVGKEFEHMKGPPKESLTADFYKWYKQQAEKQFEKEEDKRASECLRIYLILNRLSFWHGR